MKRSIVNTAVLTAMLAGFVALTAQQAGKPPMERPVQVAPGVWFQQHHDIGMYGSNVGWIEFSDYVVVIDTAFPLGAEEAIRNIKETTKGKPIRYAIVTHYHGDHSFGTGAFAKEGATIVAHENARRDYLARNVASYEARKDETSRKYKAYAPDLTFTDTFVLDDGQRRAEVRFLGHAHTTGCVFTWLPKEKVLFTGDACVNGPYNYMGDADSASWIDVLTRAQGLGAEKIAPGHGALAKGDLLATQKRYFTELRAQVAALVDAGKTLDEVKQKVDVPMWREWTGEPKMKADNIAHVYKELTRGPVTEWQDPGGAVAVPNPGKLKFLHGGLPADQMARLREVAPNVEFVTASGPEAFKLAPEVHGCTGNFANAEFLREAKNLRWVQQFSAGVEHLVSIPELAENDRIVLTNMKRMYGPNIADHAFALLLSLIRGLPHYQGLMKEGTWGKGAKGVAALELKDKTMVIVGVGGIGSEVAKRAHAFGMRVLAVDPRDIPLPEGVLRLEKPERLEELLPEADVVTVCAPLTSRTKGLFGTSQFALMKPSARFINIARGKIYDNAALDAALRSGKLAGAGLDVTDPEPLPTDHPLWKAPHVIITPHVATLSPDSEARRRRLFTENMRRFAAGEGLLNVVDKKAGF